MVFHYVNSTFCGDPNVPNHSSGCTTSSVVIFFDFLIALYCILVACTKRSLFVSAHSMSSSLRAVELFCVYLVGFLLETWILEAAYRIEMKPYEIASVFSKLVSCGAYFIVARFIVPSTREKGRVRIQTWPLPLFMAVRLALYFAYFFPWLPSWEEDKLVYGVILARSVFRFILFCICIYQCFWSIFISAKDSLNENSRCVNNECNEGDVSDFGLPWKVLKKAFTLVWRDQNRVLVLSSSFFGVAMAGLQVLAGWAVGNMFDEAIEDRVSLKTGIVAMVSTSGYILCSFFDQWLRGLLSQKLLSATCLTVLKEQPDENYKLLVQNFLEIRYLFQYNFFDTSLAVLRIVLGVGVSFCISWNLTLLCLFLIPAAIPFKVWDIDNSERMKERYSLAQKRAVEARKADNQKKVEEDYHGVYRVVSSFGYLGALYNQTTKFILGFAVILFVWLADVYTGSSILPIFFLFSIVGSAFGDVSENIVHIFQTVASAPIAFKLFVNQSDATVLEKKVYGLIANLEDEEARGTQHLQQSQQSDPEPKRLYSLIFGFLVIAFVATVVSILVYRQQTLPEDCDVAIIGSGVGGLWTAYRLLEARPDLKVCLFEQGSEIGGRLRTRFFEGAPNLPIELGGMQFERWHLMVFDLVQRFNLSYFPRLFPTENFNFLRNTILGSAIDWGNTSVPYVFSESDRKLLDQLGPNVSPYDLLQFVFPLANLNVSSVKDWNTCDWAHWKENSTWGNTTEMNYNLGWWYACLQVLSEEALSSYSDSNGYDSYVEEANLADVISYIAPAFAEYDADGSYYRFVDGYETLATRLYDQFTAAGGAVQFGKNLQSIISTDFSNARLHLTFNDSTTIHAPHVILAMPQKAIEDLVSPGPQLSTVEGQEAISSVFPVPAFKLFLVFDYPWWTKFNFTTGIMHTTLPSRKVYYWGIENNASQPNNTNSVLMATYGDDASSAYWSALLSDQVPLVPFYFDSNPFMENPPSSYLELSGPDPRSVVVRDLMRQVRLAHNDSTIPDPYGGVFMDWSRAPYGGAWHAWNAGVVSTLVRQTLRNLPNQEGFTYSTYVCGEAYSDMQGWVEGALRSCEKLLIEKFNVSSQYRDYLETNQIGLHHR